MLEAIKGLVLTNVQSLVELATPAVTSEMLKF